MEDQPKSPPLQNSDQKTTKYHSSNISLHLSSGCPINRPTNIILIGYMSTGKTIIGKKLAKMTKFAFVDVDELIESYYHKKIEDIFKDEGEDSFRQKEHDILQKLQKKQNMVVATGGGLPTYQRNWDILKQMGKTVFLYTSPKELVKRLNSDEVKKRPLLRDLSINVETIDRLLNERMPFYVKADFEVNTMDTNIESVVIDIISNLR